MKEWVIEAVRRMGKQCNTEALAASVLADIDRRKHDPSAAARGLVMSDNWLDECVRRMGRHCGAEELAESVLREVHQEVPSIVDSETVPFKEMVERYLAHLGVPTGTDQVCPKCKDRCPPNTGLITISHGEQDVFIGCYICLDNEVRDSPIALALIQTMFDSAQHIDKLQKWLAWLKKAHLEAGCQRKNGSGLVHVGFTDCDCSRCALAKGDEAFVAWVSRQTA